MTSDAPSPPRVVALLNQKGGVGKTTSSVNLGAAMAEAGRRVCLIDLDPQAHMTLHVGVDPAGPEHTVYDLLVEPEVTASAARLNVRPRLDLIPSEVDLAAAEVELAHHPQRQRILCDKFAEIADEYEFVLIDCPPSLGLLTLNALLMSAEVFVPMQAHFLALQGVGKLLETVGLVCRSVNPTLLVSGIILCMHEGQTTLAREVVADLEGFFGRSREQLVPWRHCKVLHPPIRRNVKLAEAPSFGQTIFDYAPWCPGAIDYRMLAARIMAAWEYDDTSISARRPEEPEPVAEPAPEATPERVVEPPEPEPVPETVVEPKVEAPVTPEPPVITTTPVDGPVERPVVDERSTL